MRDFWLPKPFGVVLSLRQNGIKLEAGYYGISIQCLFLPRNRGANMKLKQSLIHFILPALVPRWPASNLWRSCQCDPMFFSIWKYKTAFLCEPFDSPGGGVWGRLQLVWCRNSLFMATFTLVAKEHKTFLATNNVCLFVSFLLPSFDFFLIPLSLPLPSLPLSSSSLSPFFFSFYFSPSPYPFSPPWLWLEYLSSGQYSARCPSL